MKNGFPGESLCSGAVAAVKTHEYGPEAIAPFDRAVLLVREPFASIQAEFNRRSGGHVGHASADKYRRDGGAKWRAFARAKAEEWARMNMAWHDAFVEKGESSSSSSSSSSNNNNNNNNSTAAPSSR